VSEAKKFELHIPSIAGSEKRAMEFAADMARKMNFPPERVEDLKTAVAEACMNAIEHGNQSDAGTRVGIRLTAGPDSLQVAVQDRGRRRGIPRAGAPDIASRVEGSEQTRGWGIFLIENLMDEVSFESNAEGNVVKMIIYLDKPA
jgi:serine/threonine-protein kinase RsbW